VAGVIENWSQWGDGPGWSAYTGTIPRKPAPGRPASTGASSEHEIGSNPALVKTPIYLDNAAPTLSLERKGPKGEDYEVVYHAKDSFSIITEARVTVDGGEPRTALPEDRLFDARTERFVITLRNPEAGAHSVVLEVEDEAGNTTAAHANVEVE